jgi:hypothetical protein
MWPDLWVGPEFALHVDPQRAVKGVELDLWAPDQLDAEQVLHIDMDGQRWQHHVARGARSKALLPFARRAGSGFELRIRAEQSFVPSRHGASGDERELAWRLLAVTLAH